MLSVVGAAPAYGQTFIPPIESTLQSASQSGDERALPSTLAGVHAFLESRVGGELRREFRRVFGAHPQAAMDALILRAGTRVPPGVNAARASLRQAARNDAVALLALEMERTSDSRGRWIERLSALLEAGPLVDEDLRCAAIGAVGELRAYELAPLVAVHLGDTVPRVQHAASASLFALYRLRLDSVAAFEAEWPRLAEMRDDPPFLRELEAEQTRAQALALRLIALSPRGVTTWLEDVDPVVRSGAADALSRFVGEGKVSVPDAIEALLGQLEREVDAAAFRAMLDNLTELLGGSPPGSASVVRLRDVLDRVISRRQRDLSGPILRALSRMPWDVDPESGEQSLDSGVRRVVELFGRVVDRGRPLDPDHILMGIDAIESLCLRESPTEEWRKLTQPTRAGLAYLLNEYPGSEDVRLAAAGAYSSLLADDIERMLDLLEDERNLVDLRYELLGALGRVLPKVTISETRARSILKTLVGLADAGEPGVRRRALEVLAGDVFQPHVAAVGTSAGAEALVERLEYEEDPELRSLLLELIGSFERPALVERLLLSSFFDVWTQGGSRNISEMATALSHLAGNDAKEVMRAAERLLVNLIGERQVDSQLVRLESALTLATSLPVEAAEALRPAAHGRIVGWALNLREKGGARLAGTPGGANVLERLIQVHLPGAEDVLETPARAWALLSGDYYLARPDAISLQDVAMRYRDAAARLDSSKVEYGILIRDQARFLCRVEQSVQALEAYSNLRGLETSLSQALAAAPGDPPVRTTLFELSDLRDLARLTAARVAEPDREQRAAARDAYLVGLELVQRGTWRAEPGTVRLQDLRDLAARAQRSQAPGLIVQVRGFFMDLPATPPMGPHPNAEAPGASSGLPGDGSDVAPLWDGLVSRNDWHLSLLRLRDEVLGESRTEAPSEPEVLEDAARPTELPQPDPGADSSRYR